MDPPSHTGLFAHVLNILIMSYTPAHALEGQEQASYHPTAGMEAATSEWYSQHSSGGGRQ